MRPDRTGIRIPFKNFRSKLEFQFCPRHMYVFIYRKIAKHCSPINLERLSSDSHSQRIGRHQVSVRMLTTVFLLTRQLGQIDFRQRFEVFALDDRVALLAEPNFVRPALVLFTCLSGLKLNVTVRQTKTN